MILRERDRERERERDWVEKRSTREAKRAGLPSAKGKIQEIRLGPDAEAGASRIDIRGVGRTLIDGLLHGHEWRLLTKWSALDSEVLQLAQTLIGTCRTPVLQNSSKVTCLGRRHLPLGPEAGKTGEPSRNGRWAQPMPSPATGWGCGLTAPWWWPLVTYGPGFA